MHQWIRKVIIFICNLISIKVAIIGNVDSGKSTLVGVLTKGFINQTYNTRYQWWW